VLVTRPYLIFPEPRRSLPLRRMMLHPTHEWEPPANPERFTYDQARFAGRSERPGSATTDDEAAQQAFLFEEIETALPALRAQVGKGQAAQEKRAPRPRKGVPPYLERVEGGIKPDDLKHAGKQKVLTG